MKICPKCQKTYTDENLNFCLEDGAVLAQTGGGGDSLPATVLLNPPRPTNPNQPSDSQSGWSNQNQFSMQPPPPKKSKNWLWVLGILGGLILLCGGGSVGLIAWVASLEDNKRANNTNYNSTFNSNNNPTSNTKSLALPDRTSSQKIDLSKWVSDETDLGITEYSNGEFSMSSRKKGYYYVLAASAAFKTENATTTVTARNINEADTSLGFGLLIHSNPVPLTQDYAFLIDSENKKYRVVRHVPQKEIDVVDWTRSPAIKDGTQKNVLEVRDHDKKMDFYINGQFIISVDNKDGYSGGVTGLYSSNAVPIGFSDFEIKK